MTVCRSSFSFQPSVTNSPSERPQPLKSNANTVMFYGSSTLAAGRASSRDEQFPCR